MVRYLLAVQLLLGLMISVASAETGIDDSSAQMDTYSQPPELVNLEESDELYESKWSTETILDSLTLVGASEKSWLSGSTGKFRGGSDTNNLVAQAAISIAYDLNDLSGFTVEAAYFTDPNNNIGITQAYWHLNLIDQGKWHSRYRFGAFHVPLSFENHEPLWQSQYSITPSMINTWVGEELRTIGLEGRWSWIPSQTSQHEFTLLSAAFGANDTAGSMLAWRGWAAHDRPSLLGSTITLPSLPVTEPGAPFELQASEYEPFVEVDDRIGYFIGLDWQNMKGNGIRYVYYDNQGSPKTIKHGQYAWDTRFHHVGFTVSPAFHWTIVGQAIIGNTVMGPKAVDNDFRSASILATRAFRNQRITARVETFRVVDRDFLNILDPNDENGERYTIGYTVQFCKRCTATFEASRINSDRAYRAVFGQSVKSQDDQASLLIRYRY